MIDRHGPQAKSVFFPQISGPSGSGKTLWVKKIDPTFHTLLVIDDLQN